MNKRIALGYCETTPLDKSRINQVLTSGQFSPGPFCRAFEEKMAFIHGRKHGIFVNSGTDALRIALLALKEKYRWKNGDFVAVPSVTFVATANVVIQAGLKPHFIDVGMNDYNMNPAQLENYLRPPDGLKRVQAIIPVHLFGQCADMPQLMQVARKHKLKVIEDSCETVLASVKGKLAGTWGDIACFSTYQAHILATGCGGIAVTDDPKLNEIMRSLANHGRDTTYVPGITNTELSPELIAKRFRFVRHGYSCRPTEFEAALGIGQLERLAENVTKRRIVARELIASLDTFKVDLALPVPAHDRDHSYMMFPIVIKESSKIKKADLVWHLEQCGIETRDMMPLINQPIYADLVKGTYCHSVAKWINENGFYIACHPGVTRSDITHIRQAFGGFFYKFRSGLLDKKAIAV